MSGNCFSSGSSTPASSTTLEQPVLVCNKSKHIVIILGSPGTYDTRDPSHDQSWSSFFVTTQYLVTNPTKNEAYLNVRSDECVDIMVYKPGYVARFDDDNKSSRQTQKNDANKYQSGGYIGRIRSWCRDNNFNYIPIYGLSDIADQINKLQDGALRAIYFVGHGAGGIWLSLEHSSTGVAQASTSLIIDAAVLQGIKSKVIDSSSTRTSIFIGCNTNSIAQSWKRHSGLKSAGSTQAINFKYIDTDKDLSDGKTISGSVVHRILTGAATSTAQKPQWRPDTPRFRE